MGMLIVLLVSFPLTELIKNAFPAIENCNVVQSLLGPFNQTIHHPTPPQSNQSWLYSISVSSASVCAASPPAISINISSKKYIKRKTLSSPLYILWPQVKSPKESRAKKS